MWLRLSKVKQTNIGGLYFQSHFCLPLGLGCVYTVSTGIGTWGLNKTVGWAWDITNFVWWVVLVTLVISAVLLLFRQRWRMAINRSAEAQYSQLYKLVYFQLYTWVDHG
jgi:hypothetical protein